MNTVMVTLLSLLIFIAAAGAIRLPRAANPVTAVGGAYQQAQLLDLYSSDCAQGWQSTPGRRLLQTNTSDEEKLLDFVRVGNTTEARRILDGGADPNFQNEYGLSPLIMAIASNNAQMVQLLVEFGAYIYDLDVEHSNGENTDALHLAASLGSTEAMVALLEAGATLDKLDRSGWSALHFAVHRGQIAAATFLLDEGAAIDVLSVEVMTPLFLAVSIQNLELVRLLTSRGADVESLNTKAGMTPLVGAVIANSIEVVQELITAGADANKMGRIKQTPLYFAVYLGHIGPMKVLIKNGADMSVQVDGNSLKESLCNCTKDPQAGNMCNFIACRDPESMEALLE